MYKRIEEILSEIQVLKAEYQESVATQPAHVAREISDKSGVLRQELTDILIKGAGVCPECGNKPHGLIQPVAVEGIKLKLYEVRCLVHFNNRARGITIEEAVKKWNNKDYMPERRVSA